MMREPIPAATDREHPTFMHETLNVEQQAQARPAWLIA
jgi:hypothetical protein